MGSISSQAFKSTIFSSIGVVLGFLTVGFLFPRILSTSEVGVVRLILNYSEIAARIAALGTGTIIVRYFTHFKNDTNHNNGFLSYMILINLIGIGVFLVFYFLFGNLLIEHNQVKSPLFASYFYWIVPVTISVVAFHLFDTYSTALKMSAIGIFFKEFVQRFFIAALLIGIWFIATPFETTIWIYFSIIISSPVLFGFYLYFKKRLGLSFNHSFLKPKLIKEVSSVASFALLTGIGGTTVVFIDNIMINEIMSESETGIYSTVFLYTALILIPTKSLSKIASSFVAESFTNNNLDSVKSIYYKSCMNQFLPGFLIFIFIWVNADFIFYILPEQYEQGRNLLLILGIANLFNAITGINTQVIAYSPLHRFNTVFITGLLAITVLSNLYFIPIYGITGAAIATAISLFTFNLAKFLLLWNKYRFQPFGSKYLILIVIGIVTILLTNLINAENIFIQSFLRTVFATIVFGTPTYYFKISAEINDFAKKLILKYLKKIG
jgi:O-antigen/teichoic acid export membrane protein